MAHITKQMEKSKSKRERERETERERERIEQTSNCSGCDLYEVLTWRKGGDTR